MAMLVMVVVSPKGAAWLGLHCGTVDGSVDDDGMLFNF